MFASLFLLAARLPLKVTLVWTDPPGEGLQSDFHLIVKSRNLERHGNMRPGSRDFDRKNNVEQVVWDQVPAGTITISVVACDCFRPAGLCLGGKDVVTASVWQLLGVQFAGGEIREACRALAALSRALEFLDGHANNPLAQHKIVVFTTMAALPPRSRRPSACVSRQA